MRRKLRAIGDYDEPNGNHGADDSHGSINQRQGNGDEENRDDSNKEKAKRDEEPKKRKGRKKQSKSKSGKTVHSDVERDSCALMSLSEVADAHLRARKREARRKRRSDGKRKEKGEEIIHNPTGHSMEGRGGKGERKEKGEEIIHNPTGHSMEGHGGKGDGKKRTTVKRPVDPTSRVLRSKGLKKSPKNKREAKEKRRLVEGEREKRGKEMVVENPGSDANFDPDCDTDGDDSHSSSDDDESVIVERQILDRRNKRKDYTEEDVDGIGNKKRKTEVAMQQGRKSRIIPFAPFVRLVREITQPMGGDFRWNKGALHALQCAAEHELHDVFVKMQMAAEHAKRKTTQKTDFKLMMRMTGREMKSEFTDVLHKDSIELFNQCKGKELDA